MEYLIDKFNEEFNSEDEKSFLTLFSLLSSIVFYSKTTRLNSQLLEIKISEYYPLDKIKCQFYSKSNSNKNEHIKLNEELTVSQLIDSIKQGLLYKIENGRGLYKDYFSSLVEHSQSVDFLVTLDMSNTQLIIEMILSCFNEFNLKLQELQLKFNNFKDVILKHNYSSNAVKGNSYYFTVDDFFITSKKEQILKIGIINSWSDTDRFHSLNIEIKNLELIIENEEIGNDFWNLLKANEER